MEDRILVETFISSRSVAEKNSAFRNLVQQFQDRVFNTCLGFLHNKEDAEDVSQEVFVEVHNSLAGFRGDSQLSTWVYRIAVTKSLDHLRWKKRKKRFGFLQSLVGAEGEEIDVADELSHPGVQMEDKERAEILFAHVEKLPENQRIALTMHMVEGLSYKEIGEMMAVSVSSVESLIFRARSTLKKKLYDFYKNSL
jgi:RNA polymerase sigma-70 factor (ECF subfamily)